MAERGTHEAPRHDGRFGERFDGEIDLKGVFWVAAGIVLTAVAGMLITWWSWKAFVGEPAAPPDAAAVVVLPAPPRQPEGVPLLEPHPEAELEALEAEMADELSSWQLDPATGTAKVPIEVAIEVLLARGVPSRVVAPQKPAGGG